MSRRAPFVPALPLSNPSGRSQANTPPFPARQRSRLESIVLAFPQTPSRTASGTAMLRHRHRAD